MKLASHIIQQTLAGKSINRMLMNFGLQDIVMHGNVLDLGAGNIRSSYINFLRTSEPLMITSLDISPSRKPDILADLEHPIPVDANTHDAVLCFNLLEHIHNYQGLVNESYRVLKTGGALIGYVPFLVKFHPDPSDFFRYTSQGLERILRQSGFSRVDIEYIGRGPFTAAWSQMEYILPRFIRWPITLLAFVADAILLRVKPVFKGTYPLGYLFVAHK